MTQHFRYKEKISIGSLWLPVMGIACLWYAFHEPFNLRMGRLVVLKYPYTMYSMAAISLLFIYFGVSYLLKFQAARKLKEPIVVSDYDLEFNYVIGYGSVRTRLPYSVIAACELVNRDEKGPKVLIETLAPRKQYEFVGSYFENESAFNEFRHLVEQRCGNLSRQSISAN